MNMPPIHAFLLDPYSVMLLVTCYLLVGMKINERNKIAPQNKLTMRHLNSLHFLPLLLIVLIIFNIKQTKRLVQGLL
ncbi:uncharacterized protein CYBJADRAFT_56494 [Cyberlindnera jadinii NRRL Y-1542]|uniref:Uncharacterized protein n=1 Tax=Cyberlindnera jadinii (strain ATCC 18201 / CBS 1600 / BCRC 20928 / JCM 3617 / NBRC 0987 / NRRL Y-1542) TaxID=983966 RepID=A0A1E4RU22_CYBJN|nr:hypothetical protein CYBJADRAFT_56494 [Cyberlindnera jadinii NRRL Y-1542]ODV70760.1 hypothetical protein CYBJADRAFT_56494 [Cyberlindnera jadinii NRRL Y-1542]